MLLICSTVKVRLPDSLCIGTDNGDELWASG